MSAAGWAAWYEPARAWVERALAEEFERVAPGDGPLAEAARYALFAPGKRLRPCLVRLVGEALGADERACSAPAAAVEFVHTYSLVHDDLPCMDDDELRRGRPTCHVVFGEALALLAGDALQTAAFEALARADADLVAPSVAVLARAAGARGMVNGQVLDLSLPAGASADEVEAMHAQKTGALISASAELGAIAARADERTRAEVLRYGRALGACFQAVDDVLDVTGDAQSLGKTPGKDQKLRRATLVAVLGLDGARAAAASAGRAALDAARALGFGAGHPGAELVEYLLHRTK